jgi:DNA-binding transcriptional LysR family regulator
MGEHMDRDSRLRNSKSYNLAPLVDLVHLRYAVAAADHGSFRRAAEAMLIRQSTLSRCVRQLEERISIIVFERSSGGVRATQGGRNFLRTARSILEQVDTLVASAHSAGREEAGRLTIGFYTSITSGNLKETLVEFRERFPKFTLCLIETSRTRLGNQLRDGSIDVAIVTGDPPLPDSKSIRLWSERILVALPQTHRLATNETICWADLKGETLLLSQRDPGSEILDLLTTRLISSEDRPTIIRHDVSLESIGSLVGAGLGIGLTLEASLGANVMGIAHRELRDGTAAVRIGYSANWRADNENYAVSAFLGLLGRRYPPLS